MFRSYPLLSRFLLVLLLPGLMVTAAGWHYLKQSLPQQQGQVFIDGISAPVTLARDTHGVVSITADTDQDVFFAMGYAHAQDRLWQLELQRRTTQGRLSEIFGRSAVDADVWMRTLGLYPSAKQALAGLSAEAKTSLSAYAAGVNAWLASGAALGPEFIALDIIPQPWSEIDSLAWVKFFALNLSNNMWQEVEYLAAKQVLSTAQLATLFSDYPADGPTTASNDELVSPEGLAALLQIKQLLQDQFQIGGKYFGSNAWVVSGKLSDSGHAMLANDPHLGLQIPSPWYVVKQQGKTLRADGMSLVGLPLVLFGKNQHIAWGATAMMADAQDLYIQQLNPQDPNQYRANGQWLNFERRVETFNIKADSPVVLNRAFDPIEIEVRSTIHGPLISDVVSGFEHPVSLKWTALQADDSTYDAFLTLNYASNWTEFQSAMHQVVAPALNMFYSDIDDNIGFVAAGTVPIRTTGVGLFPVPGWDDDYIWQGTIAPDQMPRSFNPEKGYIVSANNKIVGSDYPHFISHDWAPPARAERIEALIKQHASTGKGISMAQMQQMQADTVDLSSLKLLALAKTLKGETQLQRQALHYLADWQGDMSKNSQAATVFYGWTEHLGDQLFGDELKGFWNRGQQASILRNVSKGRSNEQILLALTDSSYDWCDDKATVEVESCEHTMIAALDEAVKKLEKLQGDDIADWHWGEVHRVVLDHQPFSQVGVLKGLFGRTISSGGSPSSINVANAYFEPSKGYQQNSGASFRQIIQLAGDDKAHFYMNSTGQSGHVLSPHYDDMFEPFNAVAFFDLNADLNASPDQTKVLTLKPQSQPATGKQ